MIPDFYKAFQHAAYPCYWLAQDGTFWMNDAAEDPQAFQANSDIVHSLLAKASLELSRPGLEGILPSSTLPADALRTQGLTIIPLENGIFASASGGKKSPILTFSTQLREPLTNIYAILPLVAKKLEDPDLRYAEEIQRNCYILLRLATNIECVGRLEKKPLNLRPLDMTALVDSLCFCVRSTCKEQAVDIYTDLPDEPLPVSADRALLNEAILNLLRNSLQYTRDGNLIQVRLKELGGRAVLTIEDQGLGVLPENLPHIFEPYFSKDPYGDSGMQPGLGLGLAIVAQTVKGLGGTVTAESRFGEGTQITMAIPLADLGSDDAALGSDAADYLSNRYSPVYIQMASLCRLPSL